MSDYITDPELLEKLNASNKEGYVTDPSLLKQLGTPDIGTQPSALENVAAQAPIAAGAAARDLLTSEATAGARQAATIAKNATSWTPNALMEVISHPLNTAQAYVAGHPWANTPIKTLAGTVGKNVATAAAQGLIAPENLLTLPYNMAAYEQEKIRQNPNAPEYANNPYAQTVRGEAPTQGVAGSANAQKALINQQYGGLSPQDQAILQADRARQMAIQQKKQQARMVLQQPPTAQNFIERSKALAELYGGVGQ